MTGYRDHAPSWCGDDLRPVVGTSCDFRFAPDPLTEREILLPLSLWRRMRVPFLPNNTSQKSDVPLAHGPDHRHSPHSVIREVDYETLFQSECMQIATTSDSMEPTREQALAVRMLAFPLSCEHLELLNGLLLGGTMPFNFPHDLCMHSAQDYLDGRPLIEVLTVQSYADILRLLPPGRQRVLLIDKQGNPLADRAVTSLRYKNGEGVPLPVGLFIVHETAMDRELPKEIRIDCTGLGGHDLGGEEPWHICFRSDRHGQSIYGPSLAETTAHDPRERPVHTVALGLTKAMHEFLTLHYFATDSATSWHTFLTERMPNGTWPGADERRQCALDMFAKCHIAPSYRRLPQPTWTTCISLLLDLLLGAGKSRYLCTRPTTRHPREVFVRGFSAGSYSGICLLHLLWKLPYVDVRGKLGGIASPPELLSLIPSPKGQRLHLFHYIPDKLCCWQPSSRTIESLPCLCTIVTNSAPELHDHFGKSEHSYGHWRELPLVEGEFHLWQSLMQPTLGCGM